MVIVLVLVILAPLLLIDLVFVAETLAGLSRSKRKQWMRSADRATIVIPAHNEERVIGRTLAGLVEAAGSRCEILLVADNCTDRTAAIATTFPVKVVERHQATQRGKGFALAFAREQLRADPPAVVVVLDADCHSDIASLSALVSACRELGRPAQAINLLEPSPSSGPLVQLSSFAFLIKNLVRQRGLQRIAGTVHLTGTGMALPWVLFDKADLATSSIVEDIRLGLELGRAGAHPRLIEDSFVWSPHADQAETLGQRSRWEGGFMALATATAPAAIAAGVRAGSPRAIFAGFDLLVPPLAILALANVIAALLFALLALTGLTNRLPLLVLLAIGSVATAALVLAWWKEGRPFIDLGSLLRLPLYVLWKLPMYLGLIRTGAPKVWQRTERTGETAPEALRQNDQH